MSDIYKGPHARRSEVDAFIQNLLTVIPVDPGSDEELIPLSRGFALYGPHPRPWAGLFSSALKGQLPGKLLRKRRERNLGMSNLLVDASLFKCIWNNNVPWCMPAESERPGCTGLEVEERLSTFPRDTSILLLNGHLVDLPDAPFVDRSQVIRIARRFISTIEIAAHLGIPPSAVQSWVKSNRVTRRDGLPMWRREDVSPLLPETAIEKPPIEPDLEVDPRHHPGGRFRTVRYGTPVEDDVFVYNISKERVELRRELRNGPLKDASSPRKRRGSAT